MSASRPYPRGVVDAVKAALPLSALAARYTTLRPSGGALLGLCPLHDETTPSFRVDDVRGGFKCFGCGRAGDHLTLLQEVERLPFRDALRELARAASVVLPEVPRRAPDGPTERRRRALAVAARYYHGRLGTAPEGAPARAYLRGRGFGADVLRSFYVGYAPRAGEGLHSRGEGTPLAAAAAGEGVSVDDLVLAGLVRRSRRGGPYDVFRGRVVFPVLDPVRGDVVGMAGRRLDRAGPAVDRRPKYVNTSEASGFEKRRALFGLHQARRAVFGAGEAVLVEGYADVLALHQAGVPNAVAAGGTAFTAEQAGALRRLGERVLVVYDADTGGAAGAVGAVSVALRSGLRPRVVTLPEGEDPASFLAGAVEVADARTVLDARATDAVSYVYESVRAGRESVEGHLEALRAVVDVLAGVVDPLTREVYLQRASEVSGTRREAVEEALGWPPGPTGLGAPIRLGPRARAQADEPDRSSALDAAGVPPAVRPA